MHKKSDQRSRAVKCKGCHLVNSWQPTTSCCIDVSRLTFAEFGYECRAYRHRMRTRNVPLQFTSLAEVKSDVSTFPLVGNLIGVKHTC